ncbi:MAG: nucleotidyltransferase domain-containing protein [Patescibacteria group bacterium]|jgi:hypothetical protein
MRTRLLQNRLTKLRIAGYFFQAVPFIRAVILNGSLATGQIKASSDIDLLIVASEGRIFTVRFLVNAFAWVSGQKRPKDERRSHAGKFCFNYFMSTSYLKIPVGRGDSIDRYCARCYSQSVLVWQRGDVFERFWQDNYDLFVRYSTRGNNRFSKIFPVRTLWSMTRLSGLAEFIFGGRAGNCLEQYLKAFQIRSIERDDRTRKYPSLIVYSDRELRFHPPKED